MHFSALVFVALAAITPAHAFIAWRGNSCDVPEGSNACEPFGGRHSFTTDSTGVGGKHCVAFYVNGDCPGQRFSFTSQQDLCTNMNTFTMFNSFRCFARAGCS